MKNIQSKVLHKLIANIVVSMALVDSSSLPGHRFQWQIRLAPSPSSKNLAILGPGHLRHRHPGAGAGEDQGGALLHCDGPATRGDLGCGWLQHHKVYPGHQQVPATRQLNLTTVLATVTRLKGFYSQ